MTEKVVRDGKVAVLISPGYGAGWYSWEADDGGQALLFDPKLVEAVENRDFEAAEQRAKEIAPTAYLGGLSSLEIEWVPVGVKFKVDEYDGYESLVRSDDEDWVTA